MGRKIICYGIGGYWSNGWLSKNPKSGIYLADTSRSLDATNCGNPTCNQGGILIVEVDEDENEEERTEEDIDTGTSSE